MNDEPKTREQLEAELAELRRRIRELEKQRQPEDDFVEDQNLLRTLIDNLPDSHIFIKDAQSRFITTNAAHLQILGAKTLDEVVGKTDFEFFPQELAAQYYADEQQVIQSGQPLVNHEERVIAKKGDKIWVLTTKVPLCNLAGEIVGLVGMSRDITAMKQAQEAVIISRDKLHRLIHQLPIGVQIFDTNGLCIDVNQAHLGIFGVDRAEQIVGRYNLFDDPMAVEVGTAAAAREALAGQVMHLPEIHFDFKQADARFAHTRGLKIISVTFFPVKNEDDEIVQIVALNEDITERKRVAQSLQDSENRYRTLVEQLPAITYIIEFDEKGSKPTYISPQVETILGFTQAEWLADRTIWVKQLYPEDKGRVQDAVERSNLYGESLDLEYRVLTRDGRVVWFRNQQTGRFHNEKGQIRSAHGVMYDITNQKQLEDRLNQAQKMEAVGQMAGGIAHNFNNVLTALIGHTELALSQVSSDQQIYQDLDVVRNSAQRAADLIRQLLAFTRDETTYPQFINLNKLIQDATTVLGQLLGTAINLEVIPASNLGVIKADPGQIEQVLINLAVNAKDAMPQGGNLTAETANVSVKKKASSNQSGIEPGEYILLTLSDTGVGMTKEVRNRIFEPFFSTKEVGKGTGLGLASCFGIVQQNNGHILVNSKPNQGTTFKIYLPRVMENVPEFEPKASKIEENLSQGSQTILVVEDALMVREMAVRVLRQQGYTVFTATNGEEAMDLVQGQPELKLHMLISDVNMPQMGGDVLVKKLLTTYPDLKVLLISGYSDRAIARRGVLEPGVATLSKPFTPDALIRKVREILSQKDK